MDRDEMIEELTQYYEAAGVDNLCNFDEMTDEELMEMYIKTFETDEFIF